MSEIKMEKRVELGMLLEFYGLLLSPRVREQLSMYLDDDFTLTEIAQQDGISRQAAYDAIKRGEAQLTELEGQLGLYGRWQRLQAHVAQCREHLGSVVCDSASRAALDAALAELDAIASLDEPAPDSKAARQ